MDNEAISIKEKEIFELNYVSGINCALQKKNHHFNSLIDSDCDEDITPKLIVKPLIQNKNVSDVEIGSASSISWKKTKGLIDSDSDGDITSTQFEKSMSQIKNDSDVDIRLNGVDFRSRKAFINSDSDEDILIDESLNQNTKDVVINKSQMKNIMTSDETDDSDEIFNNKSHLEMNDHHKKKFTKKRKKAKILVDSSDDDDKTKDLKHEQNHKV